LKFLYHVISVAFVSAVRTAAMSILPIPSLFLNLFNDSFSVARYITLSKAVVVNDEFGSIRKGVAVAYFKASGARTEPLSSITPSRGNGSTNHDVR
jgi:hypothetical protein